MKPSPLGAVVRHLRRAARPGVGGPSSDADLLARFAGQGDESAFAEIVQRHGPLVWAVCRGQLPAADADDAFQATFLVLVRQARQVRKPASLACWLSGVARRVVRRVREQDSRRRVAEGRCGVSHGPESAESPERDEWRMVLNEELSRLPEKYRLPLLLCYYQGLTNDEAARRLGWPHGTVCGRLARARDLLRRRLTRRGVTLAAGALAAGVAGPPSDVLAATALTCGVSGAVRSGSVVLLAEAVMGAMRLGKIKLWACGLVTVAALGGVTTRTLGPVVAQGEQLAVVAQQPAGQAKPAAPPKTAKIEEIEQAAAALQKGQVDEALRLLQEAVKKKPELPPARLMLARLIINGPRDKQKGGRAVLEQAAQEHPDHPEVYLTLGSVAMLEERWAECQLDCQKALDLGTADRWTIDQKRSFRTAALAGLATVCERRKDWVAARAHVLAWLEMDPKDGQARQRLARVKFFLGDPNGAFVELQQAEKDGKRLDPPAVMMARFWSDKGDARQAREWWERAIQADLNSVRIRIFYAEWLLQQNEIDEAKRHADEAAKLKPDDANVYWFRKKLADHNKPVKTDRPDNKDKP